MTELAKEVAEFIWQKSAETLLESIAKGFANNVNKTDTIQDAEVFMAISETIQKYPIPKITF